MPQASDELRRKWGGFSGIGDDKAIAFLQKWGWKEVGNGVWRVPRPDDEITPPEWEAIQFLIEEWDYAIESA